MIQYLPENLNIDEILIASPPAFKYHRDCFIHILSLITEIPARNSSLLDNEGFVPLNARWLKKHVHNYPLYLDYLVQCGVLECNNRYAPGKRSRGYRYTATYQTPVLKVEIEKRTLVKSINNKSAYWRQMTAKYGYLYKWFDEGLKVDYAAAREWLWQRYQRDLSKGRANPLPKYNARHTALMKLHQGELRFTVDRTSGRLHTHLTGLKKELRRYITYNGQKLAEVDIRCAHPSISALLLNPAFYDEEQAYGGIITLRQAMPSLYKKIKKDNLGGYVSKNKGKFSAYLDAVNGDLYQHMRQRLEEMVHDLDSLREHKKEDRDEDIRDAMKSMMYCVMFSANTYFKQDGAWPKQLFKEMFPEVYHVFNVLKKYDHTSLSVLLQKLEVRLVLDNAAKKLAAKNPGMPVFTIHDCIVVPEGKEAECAEVLNLEATRLFGITLHVN